ncbi:MAG: glycoside hydrolase family 5 protein [Hyphomonadaceae bacterium]|nr:glycoside hydrolase family 5 protein [Hyphomonadaceae bacterium]
MRAITLGMILAVTGCGEAEISDPDIAQAIPVATPPISRCMNLGSALEASFEGEWGYTVRREDLERLKQAGFDTVRLPIKWSAHTDEAAPYLIDPDFLARVDEIVGWAKEIGLQIIVNVHHYDELNEDPDRHEPRLEAIWDQLATHYAGAPASVIFETLNEPHTDMTTARTDALNRRLLKRIRQDHPDRWVILGTAFWGNLSALEESQPEYDPRVMLTYHEYSPFAFTHQGASWTDQTDTNVRWGTRADVSEMLSELDKAVAVQDRTRLPVFVGEFGVYQGVPIEQRARWTRALREGLETRGLAWCHWDFAGSLKVYDVGREAWLPEMKSALLD